MLASAVTRSERVAELQPTAVNAILSEMRECQTQGKTIVSLIRGEPDFPTPPHIVEACERALRKGRTGYPDNRGEKAFREAVAQKLLRDNGLQFDPAREVLATTSSTFGIYAALTALLNEGLEAAWSPAARMLILNTPWNPVGTILTRQELTSCESGGGTLTHGLDRLSQGLAGIMEPNR